MIGELTTRDTQAIDFFFESRDAMQKIAFLRARGTELLIHWSNDAGAWELLWISGGRCYSGCRADLRNACDELMWHASRDVAMTGHA